MENKKTKFSCYIPEHLYIRFTNKARETSLKRRGQTRGAITLATIEAIENWINRGDFV